ncbi:hypothetical protein CDAR_484281 [Caerostris darwini]|uniref:Uncharacterized protein n=1 Tax=Caerostris darwini TaxID=1538125 RepID=A0AAV4NCN0_9ARAC|nr:hypothetical protein CDAR_484281 [Caerostris darwini]
MECDGNVNYPEHSTPLVNLHSWHSHSLLDQEEHSKNDALIISILFAAQVPVSCHYGPDKHCILLTAVITFSFRRLYVRPLINTVPESPAVARIIGKFFLLLNF